MENETLATVDAEDTTAVRSAPTDVVIVRTSNAHVTGGEADSEPPELGCMGRLLAFRALAPGEDSEHKPTTTYALYVAVAPDDSEWRVVWVDDHASNATAAAAPPDAHGAASSLDNGNHHELALTTPVVRRIGRTYFNATDLRTIATVLGMGCNCGPAVVPAKELVLVLAAYACRIDRWTIFSRLGMYCFGSRLWLSKAAVDAFDRALLLLQKEDHCRAGGVAARVPALVREDMFGPYWNLQFYKQGIGRAKGDQVHQGTRENDQPLLASAYPILRVLGLVYQDLPRDGY